MAKQPAKRPGRKTTAKKTSKNVRSTAPVEYAPVPDVITLTRQAAELMWKFKEVLGGIALVSALLGLLLVRGLGAGVNFAELRDQVGALSAYAQVFANPSGATTETGAAYQSILSIVITLATIWALRQLIAGEKITLRDAFYRGMFPLVPFILVLAVIGLQLLPAIIGISTLQLAINSDVVNNALEIFVGVVGAVVLSFISLYFLASSIVALYIVTLPNMTPILALRTAIRLVAGRRWTVLRKMLFLPLILFVSIVVVTLPFVFLIPVLVSWVLFLLGAASLVVSHTYLYNLYKRLLDEQPASN